MSHPCGNPKCVRPVPDDHFACPEHWARVRFNTRHWLNSATTARDYLAAEYQAVAEMQQPLMVIE